MRIGLLADIHSNLPALDAALRALKLAGVDAIAVAGDTIGYGPFPNECIDAVRASTDLVVAGNHELYLIGPPADAQYGRLAEESLLWTRKRLGQRQWDWLRALPRHAEVANAVVTHASLENSHEYVVRPRQVARQLQLLRLSHPASEVLVLGHTHAPMYKAEGRRVEVAPLRRRHYEPHTHLLINPGSVGQSRQWERTPRARFAILDVTAREIRWFALRYDHKAMLRGLIDAGLPLRNIHFRPTATDAVKRVLRRRTDLHWRARQA